MFFAARNIAKDHLRQRESEVRKRAKFLEEQTHASTSFEDQVIMHHMITTTFGLMPPHHARAIILYDVIGYSMPEVATALGTSPGGMKSYLSHAREEFRNIYKGLSQMD